jgi:hypothetical protein
VTSYDTSANVETAIEDYSAYTVGSSGTITDAQFVRFLALADAQVTLDDPGFNQAQANEAIALYICHMIARKKGQTGKTSLSIGKYAYSKQLATGLTSWLDEYRGLIDRVAAMVTSTTQGIQSLSTDGVTRDDANMNSLSLDQSTPYDLADESRSDT